MPLRLSADCHAEATGDIVNPGQERHLAGTWLPCTAGTVKSATNQAVSFRKSGEMREMRQLRAMGGKE